jgi:hypothetical protein
MDEAETMRRLATLRPAERVHRLANSAKQKDQHEAKAQASYAADDLADTGFLDEVSE